KANAARWMRDVLGRLPSAFRLGIRARLVSAFAGVASLTLIASVVAFFSYNYIAQGLHRIERQGIVVMNRALSFGREAAEYSSMASTLQAAGDKATLATSVAKLEAMHNELSLTLGALKEGLPTATALGELEDSINGLARSVHDTATIIEHRLSTTA